MTPDRTIQRYDCDKGIHYPATSGPWMKAADLDALLAQERAKVLKEYGLVERT